MRWGTELWDRFDEVSKHVLKGIDFCAKYNKFLEGRVEVETNYAKNLKKLCNQFDLDMKDKSGNNSMDRPTYLNCYSTILDETRDVASQHELIAENITTSLLEKINTVVKILKEERKQCINDRDKYLTEYHNCEKELLKARENYEHASKSLERAVNEHYHLDQTDESTKASVKDAEEKVIRKRNTLNQFNAEYAAQLGKTNTIKSLYYQAQLPKVFDMMQGLEVKRIEAFRSIMNDSILFEQEVIPRIEKCHNQMFTAVKEIDPNKDIEKVTYSLKTGLKIPEDYKYQEIHIPNPSVTKINGSNGSTNVSSTINSKSGTLSAQLLANLSSASLSANTKRKDKFKTLTRFRKVLNISGSKSDTNEWSGLPPEQIKNRLAEKISNLKIQIDKTEKSRGGAIKMHNTYLNNQALGDSRQTEIEIENMNQMIISLNNQLNTCIDAYNKIEAEMNNNFNTLAYNSNNSDNNHIYQSPSQHSVNSGNISIPGTPMSNHSSMSLYSVKSKTRVLSKVKNGIKGVADKIRSQKSLKYPAKTPNSVTNIEHYAVASINRTDGLDHQKTMGYNAHESESFDEDDDDDLDCEEYENPAAAAVKTQILKTQQQYQPQGLVSKASIESDCNSFTKQSKDIMYADSQYDHTDSSGAYQHQQTLSSEEFAVIGNALVLFDYKKGDIGSAMDIDVNESLSILERDSGDGWTLAQRLNGEKGYVPTQYIDIVFY